MRNSGAASASASDFYMALDDTSSPMRIRSSQDIALSTSDQDSSADYPSSPLSTGVPTIVLDGPQLRGTKHFDVTPAKVAIAIDPVALITTECITVTSAMRKHARWAHSSVSAILGGVTTSYRYTTSSLPHTRSQQTAGRREAIGARSSLGGSEDDSLQSRWGLRGKRGKSMQDNPLMSAFARLRSDLRGCTGLNY